MAPVRKLTLLVALAASCRSPQDDYDSFLARTCRGTAPGDAQVQSRLADLSGPWLVHALLAGGLELGLRMSLTMDQTVSPIAMHATFWLATANPAVDAPILETDTTVNADGTFVLRAEPLVLGPEALKVDSTVEANVVLSASTLAADQWCGTATGTVDKPLLLDLAGSTFAARRDDGKTQISAVPSSCNPGATPTCGKAGPVRPTAPDLSSVPSKLADLSGQWILSAKLAGSLTQKLWVSLTFVPGSNGASLDGALRKATDPPGGPALLTFSTAMTADGRFELWLPELAIGTVRANLLLAGATLDKDAFCGKGAGEVQEPFQLDLAGTTFGAARFIPGTPIPDTIPDRCP